MPFQEPHLLALSLQVSQDSHHLSPSPLQLLLHCCHTHSQFLQFVPLAPDFELVLLWTVGEFGLLGVGLQLSDCVPADGGDKVVP